MGGALGGAGGVPAFGASAAGSTDTLTLSSGKGDIPSADPALASDTASTQVVVETHPQLARANEEDLNKILPGMAEKWDVSDDGLTYTFHIRNTVPWVKWDKASSKVVQVIDSAGRPMMVNAHDFEHGI